MQGLDYAIYQAQRNGVRLLLSLVNNWHDYGGKAKYVAWAKAAGESVDNEDDFFTNSKCRQYYKNHVKVRIKNPLSISNSISASIVCISLVM